MQKHGYYVETKHIVKDGSNFVFNSIPRICENSIELRNAFNFVFDLFLNKESVYIEKVGERLLVARKHEFQGPRLFW